jgi:hypothetical protein
MEIFAAYDWKPFQSCSSYPTSFHYSTAKQFHYGLNNKTSRSKNPKNLKTYFFDLEVLEEHSLFQIVT